MKKIFRNNWTQKELQLRDDIVDLSYTMSNGGVNRDGARVTIQDAISTPSAPMVFKRVISEVVQEAIEPVLIGTSLLDRIDYDGYGTTITFGTLGAISGVSLDIAEGMEYPEFSTTLGNGTVTATIGKSGFALKITEEMIRYSQWDIVAMHLKQASKALARWKEKKIFNMLNKMGVVVFDNDNPNASELGRTTGRDITTAGNGSMTMDDLVDMYASSLARGFTPNVILVHPLVWSMWMKDPILRAWAMENGGGNLYNLWSGQLSPQTPDIWRSLGKTQAPSPMDPSPNERIGTQQSTPNIPSYFPFGGLRLIATPEVPFDPVTKKTSIIMADTSNLGAIIVAEDPVMEEWRDPSVDIYKTKVRERYALALYHEGLAVSVARNVSIEPNEIVLPPQTIISGVAPIARK